jgi:hypothetical protein
MVPILSLWAPILVSAVIVFVASSLIHMVLPYHRNDFGRVPNEDAVMEALRKFDIPHGEYMMPRASGPRDMKSPEFQEKLRKGPVAMINVMSGDFQMGRNLAQWFVYLVVVGIFTAYVAGRALAPGAPYRAVFRFAGCAAFLSYVVALWQLTIWYRRPWGVTLKSTFDGLVYALLTAGTFGWLWPR